jgi:glycosyltransferase involved in cell wall biosynthesis
VRVAIVHDYLNQAGGAERVVASLHQLYPEAPIYTTILDRETLWPALRDADIRTSWMQRLPGLKRHFKKYLPLYPAAIESFDLREYDLIVSSSSAFAKAARARPDALHVCYCHTPMRFVWDYERYVERESYGALTRSLLPPLIRRLRAWDLRTAARPDLFVANSTFTAARIRRLYGRSSSVVFPPVELAEFTPEEMDDDYYLVVCRLNPYKRVDLAIQAFNGFDRRLVIVGDGPDRRALQRVAGSNVRFAGRLTGAELARCYARCRALIFPGEEDFGIAPLEANAAGRPVIAFRAGGALDNVIEGVTGVFFAEQQPASLREAVLRCERIEWPKSRLRAHARTFGESAFRARFREVVESALMSGKAKARPSAARDRDPPESLQGRRVENGRGIEHGRRAEDGGGMKGAVEKRRDPTGRARSPVGDRARSG